MGVFARKIIVTQNRMTKRASSFSRYQVLKKKKDIIKVLELGVLLNEVVLVGLAFLFP